MVCYQKMKKIRTVMDECPTEDAQQLLVKQGCTMQLQDVYSTVDCKQ